MRILVISESAAAGVGRHVIDLCEGLVAAGDDVHLLHSERRIDRYFEDGLSRLAGRAHVRVVDMRRAPHPSDLGALRTVRRYVAEHGPFDIVHGQSSKGGAIARLACARSAASVIYTPHCIYTLNPSIRPLARRVYGRAELWLAGRTDAVIAVSPVEATHLVNSGFAAARVHCVPNGIAPAAWRTREDARRLAGVRDDERVVGFLGRLSAQKNPLLLLEAFSRLQKNLREAILVIAGTGPLEEECRAAAVRLGVGASVRWLGYQRPIDVLPAFDVFALSSTYEAMPYVFLESLGCGLPIVSTDVGGTKLTVRPGRNGYVVPRDDAHALASALELTLEDEQRRLAMSESSHDLAREFSLQAMLDATRGVYRSAIADRNQGHATEAVRKAS